jgi:phage I-like protein
VNLRNLRTKNICINHDVTPEEIAFGTAVNVSPIDETTDDWIVISPYGEFPNEKGTQIVDRESANAMVVEFNSVLGKLGRLFRGAPIYRGHPDARPDIWPDDVRYGRINALDARDDGLYGKVAWNDLGVKNKEQGYYVYPSPAWNFKKIDGGKIKPNRLKSIGLTNNPNIFEAVPLTNSVSATTAKSEQQQQKEQIAVNEEQKKKLCEALGLDPANTTPEQLIIAMNTLKTRARHSRLTQRKIRSSSRRTRK